MALRRLFASTTFGRLVLGKESCVASKYLPANKSRGVRLESTVETAEPSPKLFVSGLSKRTTDDGLRAAFEKFGRVLEARVVTDRMSGVSKGFAFVRYASQEEADKGKEGMDGKFLDGWVIFADYAKPRPPRTFDNSQGPNQTFGGAPRSFDNYRGSNNTFGWAPTNYDNFPGSNNTFGGAPTNYDNSQGTNSTFDGVPTYESAQKY